MPIRPGSAAPCTCGFADGRKATNLDHRRDLDEIPAPDPPTLRLVRWEGYDRLSWEVDAWVLGPAAAGAAGLRL